jgi:IPT/TIG domain
MEVAMADDPPQWGSKPTPTQEENDLAAIGQSDKLKEFDGSELTNPPDGPDVILVTSVNPSSAVIPDASLTVNGIGFTDTSKVHFDNAEVPATFVSNSRMTTDITGQTPGDYDVQVVDGSLLSNIITFSFTDVPPAISSLSPSTAVVPGSPLTVNGSDFDASSVIVFNNADLSTTFVSATSLTANLTGQVAGTFDVKVRKGALLSNVSQFTFTDVELQSARRRS